MKPINEYPVSFPYGATDGVYYGPNGSVSPYHKGDDRAAPTGTPVIVNGTNIGLVGTTGVSSGSHLHLQKNVGGVAQNPNGQGFNLKSPVVDRIGYDQYNGNFVVLKDSDGVQWYYLHLSKINVSQGQKIGEAMTQSEAEKVVTYLYRLGTADYPNPGQASYWVPRVKNVPTGLDELGIAMLDAQKPSTPAEYIPYSGEQLFTKKKG